VVQSRDDDGGANSDQDDERADPEDAPSYALFDLARGDYPDIAKRTLYGAPAPGVAPSLAGVWARAPAGIICPVARQVPGGPAPPSAPEDPGSQGTITAAMRTT
jgi:hypothetical protein